MSKRDRKTPCEKSFVRRSPVPLVQRYLLILVIHQRSSPLPHVIPSASPKHLKGRRPNQRAHQPLACVGACFTPPARCQRVVTGQLLGDMSKSPLEPCPTKALSHFRCAFPIDIHQIDSTARGLNRYSQERTHSHADTSIHPLGGSPIVERVLAAVVCLLNTLDFCCYPCYCTALV